MRFIIVIIVIGNNNSHLTNAHSAYIGGATSSLSYHRGNYNADKDAHYYLSLFLWKKMTNIG